MLFINKTIKDDMLDSSFRAGGNNVYYLSIPNPSNVPSNVSLPTVQVVFTTANNGITTLASPVQFAVAAGTLINQVLISTKPLTGQSPSIDSDIIELEGSEIKDFETAGIYLISSISIEIKDGI